ncbi:2Fe-2S iron-sulfur cluster-binding protein [Methylobacterium nodulans]|uniref:Ferredoxin n=1 Tax=Methylobacterium nodulans (strain LMG 21967 / CNCM I-2342 / ORS 2060) TaxID=460265 RepID=B8IVY2_METNO|nr:2Fe-2S iron-sulfur cluster-binding protein [Methylobacterium nodulans]ACL62572.1 ferredoxin [Methylobacterium nodulans ORS 2060]
MPRIVFVGRDGAEHGVEVPAGISAMAAAIRSNVRGIEAECGGSLDCATCHVYVDNRFVGLLPEPSELEREMLACVAADRRETSRLSCQIVLTPELEGLTLHLPEVQS